METDHSEALMPWMRSTRCGTSACVEVAVVKPSVHVRDSKDPDGGSFGVSSLEWGKFVAALKSGRFDG